jgi:hypothetical protein
LSLRLAFDLDGVLADMEGALVRQAEGLFGDALVHAPPASAAHPDVSSADSPASGKTPANPADATSAPTLNALHVTGRQERRLWQHVQALENFWQTLDELEPGLVARLSALATERRWEVIFLTKRPETVGATAQVQTQRWLESKGFALPSVYVVQGSRGSIAAALGLDIVVDDRPENCLDVVVDSKARAILIWRDDEATLPVAARRLGIGVVKSAADCLDILTELQTLATEPVGMVERAKGWLGLTPGASRS